MDLKVGALETDIKSLKKAARQTVGPELQKRIGSIIETGLIEIKDDFKIYWKDFPIAKLTTGKDYLNPDLLLIVDDILENNDKQKLSDFLEKWGTGMAKCGLADCWNAVEAGQGLVLQVERGYRAPMYRSAQGQFSTTDESNGSIYMPDALDELMERTLRKGGKVLLVDNNLLATAQRVALVLRYPTKLPV